MGNKANARARGISKMPKKTRVVPMTTGRAFGLSPIKNQDGVTVNAQFLPSGNNTVVRFNPPIRNMIPPLEEPDNEQRKQSREGGVPQPAMSASTFEEQDPIAGQYLPVKEKASELKKRLQLFLAFGRYCLFACYAFRQVSRQRNFLRTLCFKALL